MVVALVVVGCQHRHVTDHSAVRLRLTVRKAEQCWGNLEIIILPAVACKTVMIFNLRVPFKRVLFGFVDAVEVMSVVQFLNGWWHQTWSLLLPVAASNRRQVAVFKILVWLMKFAATQVSDKKHVAVGGAVVTKSRPTGFCLRTWLKSTSRMLVCEKVKKIFSRGHGATARSPRLRWGRGEASRIKEACSLDCLQTNRMLLGQTCSSSGCSWRLQHLCCSRCYRLGPVLLPHSSRSPNETLLP